MKINQYDIWLANLNPQKGTEPGKVRPVVVIQSNILNEVGHPSTIVCPITTNTVIEAKILRVLLDNIEELDKPSHILVDQIRAIDNRRLLEKIGRIDQNSISLLKKNVKTVLDL